MRIEPGSPIAPSSKTGGATANPSPAQWATGQLLQLRVESRVDAQTLRVQIDGQTMLARTALDLAPGTTTTATVIVSGERPEISLAEFPGRAAASATLQQSLAQALPRQAPLAETVPAILSSVQMPEDFAQLPVAVQRSLVALAQALPATPDLMQPTRLAQVVARAGSQLESALATAVQAQTTAPSTVANPTTLPQDDLKWRLLAVREAVSQALGAMREPQRDSGSHPPDGTATAPPRAETSATQSASSGIGAQGAGHQLENLLRDVDASLARLTTHQLQTATAAQADQLLGFFELPLQADLGRAPLTLEVEQDGRHGPAEAALPFTVKIEVPLGEMGTFRARIALAGDRVAVATWSDSAPLRALIAERLQDLDAALTQQGLAASASVVRKVERMEPLRGGPEPLVDIKA